MVVRSPLMDCHAISLFCRREKWRGINCLTIRVSAGKVCVKKNRFDIDESISLAILRTISSYELCPYKYALYLLNS